MRMKALGLGILLAFIAGCALGPRSRPETNYEQTRVYADFSFDEIWEAAVKAIDETEFAVRTVMRDSGLIDARKRGNGAKEDETIPLMNIFIVNEDGQLKVKCLVAFPGIEIDLDECRQYTLRFFERLNNGLGL